MAQAKTDPTHSLIERRLDEYVADLIKKLGCENERYPALWETWERIANKRLLFFRQRLVDGKPYLPWDHPTIHGTIKPCNRELVNADDFRNNYKFEFDDHDRVKVISHEWFVYRYTVAEPVPPKRMSAQDWVTAEAIRLKKDNKIPEDAGLYKKRFAQLLAKRMAKAAETDKTVRPVKWEHIKNMLPEWKLWPVESIKIS